MNLSNKELNFLIKNHLNYLNESLVAGENVDSGDFIIKTSDKDKLTGSLEHDLALMYKITDFTKDGHALIIKPSQINKWRNSSEVDRALLSKDVNLKDYNVVNVEDEYVNFTSSLLDEGRVKASKTQSGKKVPGKYLTKDKAAMKKEIERVSKLKANDPSAYGKWEADYKARNTKSGKPHKTKKSAATIAYEKKFGKKNENMDNSNKLINEDIDKALSNKAKASGISKSILKRVYSKGAAAWKSGHRPGVSQQQWAMGRVNSFITGSGGARKADADLWAKAKKSKKRKNESNQEILLRNKIREILREELNKDLEELYPMLVGEDDLEEGLGKTLAGAALGLGLALGSPSSVKAQNTTKDDAKDKISMVKDKVSDIKSDVKDFTKDQLASAKEKISGIFHKKDDSEKNQTSDSYNVQDGIKAQAALDSLSKLVGKVEKIDDGRFQTIIMQTFNSPDEQDFAEKIAMQRGMNAIATAVKGKEVSPGKVVTSARLSNTHKKDERVFQKKDGTFVYFATIASYVN